MRHLSILLAAVLGVLTPFGSSNASAVPDAVASQEGCMVDVEGAFSGRLKVELRVSLEDEVLDGIFRFWDRTGKIIFESTEITNLVVDGDLASVQGHGKTKTELGSAVRFNATLDAAAKTLDIRLSSGYRASGDLRQRRSGDGQIELAGSCPFDGGSTPVLDTPKQVSGTVGRAGGSLVTGGLKLTIPAGALSEDTTISMTPILDLADSPLAGSVVGGAKLEPEGLRFLRPALLAIGLPAGALAEQLVGFGSAGDGSNLHLQPRTVSGAALTLELWHFSTAGAAGSGAAAAAAASRVASSAETRARSLIAAAQPACSAEIADGIVGGAACISLREVSIRALFEWYDTSVRQHLEAAAEAPSFTAEESLAEWLAWAGEVASVFENVNEASQCGTLQNECDAAHDLATSAVAAHAQRRLDNCTGTSLMSQLRDVARIADFAGAGAIDLTTRGLPDATNDNLLRECAHLDVEVTDFPKVAALFHPNTLRGRVSVDVHTGADRTDVPHTLTVDDSLVATAADGTFETTLTPGIAGLPLDVVLEAEAIDTDLQTTAFTGKADLTAPTRERVRLVAQSPTSIALGGTVGLLVQVAGDGMSGGSVSLSVGGLGSISPTPVTTDADGEATATYTAPVLTAIPRADVFATLPDGTSASLPVTIDVVVTVGLSPTAATLAPGGTQDFSAMVTGSLVGVIWSATGGEIITTGSRTALYEAGTTPGTFTVTATSIADPTAFASATITITSGSAASVTVLSRSASTGAGCSTSNVICPGESEDFAELLGVFTSGSEATVTAAAHPDFPGYLESATGSGTQFSAVRVEAPSFLAVSASATAIATASASAGTNPESGGTLRAEAFASGRSNSTVTFEVSGGTVSFAMNGTFQAADNGCVEVSLRRSGGGTEFDIDYCAGDTDSPPTESTGSLAPGVYRFDVSVSAGAARSSDYFDGVLINTGGDGSASTTFDLTVL